MPLSYSSICDMASAGITRIKYTKNYAVYKKFRNKNGRYTGYPETVPTNGNVELCSFKMLPRKLESFEHDALRLFIYFFSTYLQNAFN